MLRFLRIGHLAVIDAAELEFEPGFNVLTGETGAGKSILVEAVGLLLGGRAAGDLVRTGHELATVEAIVEHAGQEMIVRREVTAQGRSRSFLDGTLVTATALRERMAGLVELHGQHEHQTLLDPSTHLSALDAFGGLEADVEAVGRAHTAWRASVEDAARLRSDATDRTARQDLAAFQLQDIDQGAITSVDEDEELSTARRVLTNASHLQQICADAYASLYERDAAVLATLAGVWRRVGELAAIDPSFEPHLRARENIKSQLEDLAAALRRYSDGLDIPPGRLNQVEDRLSTLERLKKKYGPTLRDVLHKRDALAETLESIESLDQRLTEAERVITARRTEYLEAATRLSGLRREASRVFARTLLDLLEGLSLEKARFDVRFSDVEGDTTWSSTGIDRVEFFLSPNPGEELRPLARIVSGGELSRIMLALKTMVFGERLRRTRLAGERAPGTSAPVMIFDEVDAGLGGRVAEVVGRRLRDLGAAFQVLCITHLPQVAAAADTHFVIEKGHRDGRTETTVTRLAAPARVTEIARMMAGSSVSEAVRASARELLARGTADSPEAEPTRQPRQSGGEQPDRSSTRKRRAP